MTKEIPPLLPTLLPLPTPAAPLVELPAPPDSLNQIVVVAEAAAVALVEVVTAEDPVQPEVVKL